MKKVVLVAFSLFVTFSVHADFESYYDPSSLQTFSESQDSAQLQELTLKYSRRHLDPLGYSNTRRVLFGYVDLEQDEQGYFVKDVYCNIRVRHSVGPKKIPKNNVMNTEHTWPQSMGADREPFRGDLHHLYPTDSRANSIRGNYPFGEVDGEQVDFNCPSKIGSIRDPRSGRYIGSRGFEPPDEHKGNVARAMFYSAVVYNKHIDDVEEYYLRKWHKEDPVDVRERTRNDEIEASQGNRNPFIDFPQIADHIKNF